MTNILISQAFIFMLIRFLVCIVVNWVIIDRLYYAKSKRRDFFFTFMLMSVAIFFLVYFMMAMERGKATMGVGLGLFGIFSIMRYRTDTMPVREMTYLFLIISLSVVHAMASGLVELGLIDLIVIVAIMLCERRLQVQPTKLIQYDRIELIKPERRAELIADLENRLGLKVLKVEVGGIDFLRDMAVLRVLYESEEGISKEVDNMLKIKNSQYANA